MNKTMFNAMLTTLKNVRSHLVLSVELRSGPGQLANCSKHGWSPADAHTQQSLLWLVLWDIRPVCEVAMLDWCDGRGTGSARTWQGCELVGDVSKVVCVLVIQ